MIDNNKYDFSFTAASLRLQEFSEVIAYNGVNDEVLVQKLGNGKNSTGKRMLMEFNKRKGKLTRDQIELFKNADMVCKKQLAFLSICKSYGFIKDFVIEVIREKFLVYDYVISEGEYLSFFRRKLESHPEMEKLTELSIQKIRQVVFKILEQSGIIDHVKTRVIQPQILEERVILTIKKDNLEWLKLFFVSDLDIENFNR